MARSLQNAGVGVATVVPAANPEAMDAHLKEISIQVAPAHMPRGFWIE